MNRSTNIRIPRDINVYRRDVIRQRARDLNIALWRLCQKKAQKSLTAFDILPIEPRLIATELLNLSYEEPYEIGVVQGQTSAIEIAGTVVRSSERIVVASKFPIAVRRFTGAHEIGHWLLHANMGDLRESPLNGETMRSQFRSPSEKEADLFAADLLMPPKAVEDAFSRLFGAPVDGSRIDEGQAYCLTGGQMTARELMEMTRDARARFVAEALSMTFQYARSLADIFDVSTSAMAYQLLDLELVS